MVFKIRWIGQAGFLLYMGDKTLCIDPYLSNSVEKDGKFSRLVPIPFSPVELAADMIICTHDHGDHLDEETLRHTDYSKTLYAGPSSCIKHFECIGIDKSHIIELNRNDSLILGEAGIEGVYARHTLDSIGVVVRYENKTIYFSGDSEYDTRIVETASYRPDIAVICINGKLGNMDYYQAAEIASELGVKTAIPYHYAMFKENTGEPKYFKKELEARGIKYFEPLFDKLYDLREI